MNEVIRVDGAQRGIKMIAHRGLSGVKLENTVASFREATKYNYYGIETDVHRTADGKFVIIHDDNTKRVAGVDCSIEGTEFDILRVIPLQPALCGKEGPQLQIPTPEEYFTVCKDFDKTSVFELKNHMEKKDIAEICALIESIGWLDKTIFISFDFDNLVTVRELYPSQRIQFLCCDFDDNIVKLLVEKKMGIDILHTALTADKVKLLHKNGIEVNCWTVDSPEAFYRLSDFDVDYITTNILL